MYSGIREIETTAEALTVGRRVRLHGAYGQMDEGLIVAAYGTPNPAPTQRFLNGVGAFIRKDACKVDIILFSGRRETLPQDCIGGIGIGFRLLDRVHGPALVSRAHQLHAERVAADVLESEKAKRDMADAQRAVQVENAPVFFWNGIKDAKGAKLQRAFYSIGHVTSVPDEMRADTITITARDYAHFSPAVRACFDVENNSDMMTDYFDNDHIRVLPVHPLYPQVRAAYEAQQAHRHARTNKRA